jgi:tetratricopeptide (TPR) repeat protein
MAGGKITALERRALTYAWSGRYDLALTDSGELFDLTAKRGSMVAALANRCFLRAVAGKDLDAALADCDAVLAADRDNPDHAVSRGFALLKAARWTDALAQLNAVLVKHPKNADALYLRAACEAATSDAGDATTDRAAAVALDPKIADYYDRYGVKAF